MAAVTELPPPVSTADYYLAAIHDRLGEILDRLPARPEPSATEGEPVELREPAPTPAPPRPLTEPAKPARKPSARKTAASTPPRTRTKKDT